GASAPTSLDGVKVTVAGQSAFVAYVNPTQVNVQIPANVASGQQNVVLTNANGTSNSYAVSVAATEPGLLAPTVFNLSGKQYVVPFVPDGSSAPPKGATSGATSRPAKPGETVVLYGIGFGNVPPNTLPGQLVQQSNQLALPFTVQFGSTSASLAYKGLAPDL